MSKTKAQTQPTNPGPGVGTGQQPYVASALPPNTGSTVPGPVVNPVLAIGPRYGFMTEKKSLVEAYLLWLVFGLIGMHHFYLRRPGFGVLYFFTFGLCGAGYVIDLFRMPYLVSEANKKLKDPTLESKKNISDAYTLWFPFGLLGFHHFYLRNYGFFALYFLTLGVFGIGWLVDLIRIPFMVKDHNESTPMKLQEKNVGAAYVMAMSPLGILGCHHFYLNRPAFGFLYFFTFGLLGVGWIVDWFRVPILVQRANKELANGPDPDRHLDEAYVLWFPLGMLGLHHFYLDRPFWGAIYFFTFGLLGVGWLMDGCRLPCLVGERNKRMRDRQTMPIYTTPAMTYGHPTTIVSTFGAPGAGAAPYGAQGGYQNPGFYPPQQLPPTQTPGQYPYQQPPPYQQTNPGPVPSYLNAEQPPPYYQQPSGAPPTSGAAGDNGIQTGTEKQNIP